MLYDLVNAFNQEDPDYKLRVESLYDEGMSMELSLIHIFFSILEGF